MPRYTKKPVTIEAMEWNGTAEGATAIIDWAIPYSDSNFIRYQEARDAFDDGEKGCPATPATLAIDTLEGTMTAIPGDYIIRGVNGEFYPCKPDIFAKTYDLEDPEKALRHLEVKRHVLQTVIESAQGHKILDQQLKHAQFHSARGTLATLRGITKVQDELLPKLFHG